MEKRSIGDIVEILVRILLGIVFVVSGTLKALNPQAFFEAILTFDLFPIALAHSAALIIPYVEIFAGIALITRLFYNGGLRILTGLMLFFWFLIIFSWLRDLDITCGCFGKGDSNKTNYPLLVARNTIMALAFLWLNYRFDKRHKPVFEE